ncbi:MAG: hypothetical protein JSR67_01920 [Proteobacteria bacterium]|nr:hypothetical protein [Pseudomonadota bacterium]
MDSRYGTRRPLQEAQGQPRDERRRIGEVAHDERGNAYVRWHDAPADEQRRALEIIGDDRLSLQQQEETFDPYARPNARQRSGAGGNTTRTDLRKLSEWIRMMRELEARRQRGEDDDGSQPA